MNIGFIVPGNSFGGLEIQTVKRAIDSQQRGNFTIIFCTKNTRVHEFALNNNLNIDFINPLNPYFNPLSILKLRLLIRKYSIECLITGFTKYLGLAVFSSIFCRKKKKIYLYQQMQSGLNKKDIYHNFIYRRITGAVVLTQSMKESLSNSTIFSQDNIEVIPYGIETEIFNPKNHSKTELRLKYGLPVNSFIIGSVARIDPQKDFLSVVRAFHMADITNSFLVICGSVDESSRDYYQNIKEKVKELNIIDRVMFLPFQTDIPQIMNTFDVFFQPSLSETFGLVYIEAMSAGLSVLAVNSGGVPEIIKHGYNGFLTWQREVEKMSEYLKLLNNDRALLNEISLNNIADSENKYQYKSQTDKFFNFIDSKL